MAVPISDTDGIFIIFFPKFAYGCCSKALGSSFIMFADFRLGAVSQLDQLSRFKVVGTQRSPRLFFKKRNTRYSLALHLLKTLMCVVNEESR